MSMDNECECFDCKHNDDGICDLAWIALDLNGICTDMELGEN